MHPQPHAWESLDAYVRRLADAYETRLETFGRRALGLEPRAVRDLDRAPRQALLRLAAGTGVPLDRLEAMRGDRLWPRLAAEVDRLLAAEEGAELLARLRAASRNS